MSEYDRRVKIIERLSRFCPICGAKLRVVSVTIRARIGSLSSTYDAKECPNGHGIMDTGGVDGDLAPHAIFELDEALFEEKTFFDQVREVQEIVDEANKKE